MEADSLQANFDMLPLVVLDETQGTAVIESEAEIPHYSGLPVPQEARVIDPGNASLDLKEYLEGTTAENTKKANNHAVKTFNAVMDSLRDKGGNDCEKFKPIDEITNKDDLLYCLCKFLMVAVKPNGEAYNSSSLITLHSSLARYLMSKEPSIDIRGDATFRKVSQVLKARCSESAKLGKTPGCNKSQAAKPTDLHKAFESGTLSRKDPHSLLSLIQFQLMSLMGLRAIEEVHGILNKDLEFGPLDPETNLPEFIALNERLSKCRRGGKNQAREVKAKVFQDKLRSDICPVITFVLYQSKKTVFQSSADYPFMLNPKNSAVKSPEKELFWYSNNRCGKNTISGLFKKALEKAGCDLSGQKISATSVRKNFIQAAVEGEVPTAFVSKLAAQKNILSQLEYIVTPDQQHEAASKTVNRNLTGKSHETYQGNFKQEEDNKENFPVVSVSNEEPSGLIEPSNQTENQTIHPQVGPSKSQYGNQSQVCPSTNQFGNQPQVGPPTSQFGAPHYGNFYGPLPPLPYGGNMYGAPPPVQFGGNFYGNAPHQFGYQSQQFGYYHHQQQVQYPPQYGYYPPQQSYPPQQFQYAPQQYPVQPNFNNFGFFN